jgi:hypothetical protein
MTPVTRAIAYGAAMGVYAIASVYLVVTYLPPGLGWLIPVLAIAVPVAILWPAWFDRTAGAGWWHRFGRRMAVVLGSAPIGALTAFLVVTAVPSYMTWGDDMHRASLRQQGTPPAEIEAIVARHHQSAWHYLGDGAVVTVVPGIIGSVLTATVGAAAFRRR